MIRQNNDHTTHDAAAAERLWKTDHRFVKPNTQANEAIIPYGETEPEALVRVRRVQSFFRNAVLTSYEHRCALTNLAVPELLNASHIIPWSLSEKRRADPSNGICLNALHDRAFDRGLITFDEELRVVVSSSLRLNSHCWLEQQELAQLVGRPLRLPERFQPDDEAIAYHRRHIFRR